MYPSISHMINDLFGINIPLPIQTFGFFMVLSFIFGGLIISLELKRKQKEGYKTFSVQMQTVEAEIFVEVEVYVDHHYDYDDDA